MEKIQILQLQNRAARARFPQYPYSLDRMKCFGGGGGGGDNVCKQKATLMQKPWHNNKAVLFIYSKSKQERSKNFSR